VSLCCESRHQIEIEFLYVCELEERKRRSVVERETEQASVLFWDQRNTWILCVREKVYVRDRVEGNWVSSLMDGGFTLKDRRHTHTHVGLCAGMGF
jgi:hypothetical protein